jgi:hypothetical protein
VVILLIEKSDLESIILGERFCTIESGETTANDENPMG